MNVSILVSKVTDGTMKIADAAETYEVHQHRIRFLERNNLNPKDTTWVRVSHDDQDYCHYLEVFDKDRGDGIVYKSTIIADALVTKQPGHALFLPLADCIGAIIHDPVNNILMFSHLGRQSLEQNGGEKSVRFLVEQYGTNPHDLEVWLSPAAGKQNYPLYTFENQGLHEVTITQLTAAGVPKENIEASPIDTTTDNDYFSHSQFLKGNRETDGRFAIVAVLR